MTFINFLTDLFYYGRGLNKKNKRIINTSASLSLRTSDFNTTILANTTSGNITISLPELSKIDDGFSLYIKKLDTSNNHVLIDPFGTETIDGQLNIIVSLERETYQIQKIDNEWKILSWYDGVGLSPFEQNMITFWSGTIATIPAGWALCDGTNGTPDLRDRFVVGARQDDAGVAKTNITGSLTVSGGNTSVTSAAGGNHNHGGAAQNHTLTISQMAAHSHAIAGDVGPGPFMVRRGIQFQGDIPGLGIQSSSVGGSQAHNHTISDSGTHTHNSTIIPRYHSLVYIMKL